MKEKLYEGKPGPFCGRCPYKEQPFVGGRGEGHVMLMGDGPGLSDIRSGRVFSGLTGKRLKAQLAKADIDVERCRLSTVVQCHVPKSRAPTKTAMACCRPLLEKELAEQQPSMVITLGAQAFKAFYPGNVKSYHGAKLRGDKYTLVPMFKPDAYDDNPDLLLQLARDYRGLKSRPFLRTLEGEYSLADKFRADCDVVAIDTETTGLDLRSGLLGVGFCDMPGKASYCETDKGRDSVLKLRDRVVMHNAKYDLGILQSAGVPMEHFSDVDDTMLLAYCMNKKPLGLKDLVLQELNLEAARFAEVAGKDKSLVGVPAAEVAQYCCSDVDGTLRLWEHLWRRADIRERRLYRKIEKPLPPILARMQLEGVLVDVPHFERLSGELGVIVNEHEAKLFAKYGLDSVTLRSPTKLLRWVNIACKRQLKSTERPALERIRRAHPVIEDLLAWRSVFKLKTAFVDSILSLQRQGLVFPDFNQVGPSTGRFSCSKPNLQQLPKRTDLSVRRGFVAPDGYIVGCFDNSQIDLRTLAYESGDEGLCKIFDGADIHDETSMDIAGVVDEKHRRIAKTANFLVVFGGGYQTLAVKTDIPDEQAREFMDRYWERHPGVRRWIEGTHEFLQQHGYVETCYGRRRYIPKIYTKDRSGAQREGQNMPIQGGSADVLKLQLAAVAPIALPFGQIHDEIDFYLPKDKAVEMSAEIVKVMESVDCPFKLRVEASLGPNLGDMEKLEVTR